MWASNVIPFNPFSKDLPQVEAADLAALRSVEEGWYVEYKRAEISAEKIAKSISSFSNQHGGWLFFGVQEADDDSRRAGAFPGIGVDDMPVLETNIQRAVSAHVNPPPHYETLAIQGPCSQIGLPEGRGVLVVVVPPGSSPPYVHSSGVIYRRVGDSAEPKPENDRSTLDALWHRADASRGRLEALLRTVPERDEFREKGTSLVHLFLLPDPYGERGAFTEMTFKRFSEIMRDRNTGSISISLDNCFTSPVGRVARHVGSGSNPANALMTWVYNQQGASIISVPLRSFYAERSQLAGLKNFLRGYSYGDDFFGVCLRANLDGAWVVDLNILYFLFIDFLARHRLLAAEDQYMGPFFAKIVFENVWHRVPYFDTAGFMDFVKRLGLPVMQQSKGMTPPGLDYAGFVELEEQRQVQLDDEPLTRSSPGVTELFIYVMASMGVPAYVLDGSAEELLPAALRGAEVHKRPVP